MSTNQSDLSNKFHKTTLQCKGWEQEAALRMFLNNLDPEVAEDPDNLIVYGGTGKACRNKECYFEIINSLKDLENDETLLIQSGKPVGILKSHQGAPRVLIANSNLVGNWASWQTFHELEKKGLMMYGQMTAGSWIYIGSQGIVQGTYETFKACSDKYFNGDLKGRLIFSAGLGGMGGAQPLAATIAGAVFLGVDVDPARIQKRLETKYLDRMTHSVDEAITLAKDAMQQKVAVSIGLVGNACSVLQELLEKNFIPHIVTDQTSAHDELNGYVPKEMSLDEASKLRKTDPSLYTKLSFETMALHVSLMIECKKRGSIVFDYGNNIRQGALKGGCKEAFAFDGFVPEFIRPLFCEGQGPFRWACLSGDKNDIFQIDQALCEAFPDNNKLQTWIKEAQKRIAFQGLPARICWFSYGERKKAGLIINSLVAEGKVKAPVVIGRDHLDCGSVASPYRETEKMLDGSDAIADWPILNALINTANGASWVSFHHGGGVGMGYSLHAGMVIVADGSKEAEKKISLVLDSDPAMGILRHADAGYEKAKKLAKEYGIKIPFNK